MTSVLPIQTLADAQREIERLTRAVAQLATSLPGGGQFIPLAEKGAASGVAILGPDGKVPNSELPTIPNVPVVSVFGRTGAVVAQAGDYNVSQVTSAASLADVAAEASARGAADAAEASARATAIAAEATARANADALLIPLTQKAAANGVASLDSSGLVPYSELPPLTGGFSNQSANQVFAGPGTGAPAGPTFRALVAADIPSLDAAKITTGVLPIARIATGIPNGAQYVRDDGTLAAPPAVGTVPYFTDLSRTVGGTLDDTVELGQYNSVNGVVTISARWGVPNTVSSKRWVVVLNYGATGSAWQLVTEEYTSLNGATDIALEVWVDTSSAKFRLRRTVVGPTGALPVVLTLEFNGGTPYPTFTGSTTTSTSAITAYFTATRMNPGALRQNSATDKQVLTWDGTLGLWAPRDPTQIWRLELTRSLTSSANDTVELGSYSITSGFFRISTTVNQANAVSTKVWEIASCYGATGGAWQTVPHRFFSQNGSADWGLEVWIDSSATKFRLRRLVVGSVGTMTMSATLEVSGVPVTITTFTPSTATSTSAITASFNGGRIDNVVVNTATGGGGAEDLISETVVASPLASVSFTSIPTTYRDLRIVVRGRGTQAANSVVISLQYNGDTGVNYDYNGFSHTNTSSASIEGLAVTSAVIGSITAASAAAGMAGICEHRIYNYKGTTYYKVGRGGDVLKWANTAGTMSEESRGTNWRATTAINQVAVLVALGNLDVGTVVSLYGIK